MVTDMESDKKVILKVPELFLRGRKLNISFFFFFFVSQSYFKVPKTI